MATGPGIVFQTRVYKDGIGMRDRVVHLELKEETENVNALYLGFGLEMEKMGNVI